MTESQKNALDKVTVYLAQRDHSILELKTKLTQKKFEQSDIQWAIEEADSRGWLKSPEELAQQVLRSLNEKNKGLFYINNYLKTKGLPEVYSDFETELEKAKSSSQKFFLEGDELSSDEKAKVVRHLKNRGFSYDVIQRVVYENS